MSENLSEIPLMQSIQSSTCALLLCALATASASGEGPTTGWVVAGGAAITSGPGDAYYSVAMLAGGTTIEVHGQDMPGWFAIRPPEGCFSLVSAADVDELAGGMGRINRDGTRARVGSGLSTSRDAMHVELRVGELVHVLGVDSQQPNWLRIAPPAGEFRWIRAGDVSFQPVAAEAIAVSEHDSGDGSWRSRDSGQATLVAATTEAPATNRYAPVATNGESPPLFEPQAQPLPTSNPPQPLAGEAAEPRAVTDHSTTSPPTGDANSSPSETQNENSNQNPDENPGVKPDANIDQKIDQKIDAIEIAIALRVSEPVNVWKLDDLEQQVAGLLASTNQPTQQQVLRDIAVRLDRFAKIQRGYRATREMPLVAGSPAAPSTGTAQSPRPVDDGITPIEPANTVADNDQATKFDAIGVLRPVVSKRAGAPPYALVDDEGRIVTFVTPSPSLNVQPMLGRKVGVSGTRGFMPEYQQRHVATARIQQMPEAMPPVMRR